MGHIKRFFRYNLELIKNHPRLSVFLGFTVLVLLILAYQRYILGWVWATETGFGEYWIISIDPNTNIPIQKEIRYRTLWDWLQLLIVPILLGVGGYLLSKSDKNNEREFELDKNRESALQKYFDKVEDLIFKGLKNSKNGDEIREIARTRTISVLSMLDGKRKGILIRFLYEAGLITYKEKYVNDIEFPIIKLKSADLMDLDFSSRADNKLRLRFEKIDLSGTNIKRANLSYITFKEADFSNATMTEADLNYSSFYKCIFDDVNLHNSKVNSYFENIDLISCDFSHSDLKNSCFTHCKIFDFSDYAYDKNDNPIKQTNFTNTNLDHAKFYSAISPNQLKLAKSCKKVLLPSENKFDGPYSIFNIEVVYSPINIFGFRYACRLNAYCHCGMRLETVYPDKPNDINGYWYGLVNHRIRFHKHKILDYCVVGGRPYYKWFLEDLKDQNLS